MSECLQPAEETSGNAGCKNLPYQWLTDLESTLNNVEGGKAFESYLARCGTLPLLEFMWACDGMKTLVEENPEKCDQLVSCIYKNFIISGSLPNLSNKCVIEIAKCLEAHYEKPELSFSFPVQRQTEVNQPEQTNLDLGIFDAARKEVEVYLKDTAFPQFQIEVEAGNVCVGIDRDDTVTEEEQNLSTQKSRRSKLASHPEAFARALCEKLEGLQLQLTNRKD